VFPSGFGVFYVDFWSRVKYAKDTWCESVLVNEANYGYHDGSSSHDSHCGYRSSTDETRSCNCQWHGYRHPIDFELDRRGSRRGIWYSRGYGNLLSFFIKPKIVIKNPRLYDMSIAFSNGLGQRRTCDISNIVLTVSNSEGRVSALDAIIAHTVWIGKKAEEGLCPAGWTSLGGERRFTHLASTIMSDLDFGNQEATIYRLADAINDGLLQHQTDLFKKGPDQIALVGFGVKGLDYIYLAGGTYKLPVENAVLVVVVSNRDYGELKMSLFRFNIHAWNQAEFRPLP
jgi:hypothetical protein